MTASLALSLLINIAVGIYFARFYPGHVAKSFRGRTVPPLFRWLPVVLRPVGYLLIAGSVLYALAVLL